MKAMVAWRLDVRMARLADPPGRPRRARARPPGYAGEPPAPAAAGLPELARDGDWTLYGAC